MDWLSPAVTALARHRAPGTSWQLKNQIFPKYKEKREIDFKVTLDTEKHFINFRITNSPLADERFTSQEVCIRHEINRLLFEYFGGSYKVQTNPDGKPAILFTFPSGRN